VITDVVGSTKAIEEGRYKDVNAVGVASIVALRNALRGLDFPFVFGGDGASFLVPDPRLDDVRAALRGVQRTADEAFGLSLRAGIVAIDELPADAPVLVARYRASEHVSLAMFAGRGLAEAERLVKDPESGPRHLLAPGDGVADLTGFECRWQPIASRSGEMVSLLVLAHGEGPHDERATYREVLDFIERLAREDAARPVAPSSLELAPFFAPYAQEARLRSGQAAGLHHAYRRFVAGLSTTIGRALFSTGWRLAGFDGRAYRGEVAANTDFRKFDDTLRMVIDLPPDRVEALREFLAQAAARGALSYGLHTSTAALMTCAISSYAGDHVHFIDGSDGGYALAAKQLKEQLRARAAGE
jgi:hypothetical protein